MPFLFIGERRSPLAIQHDWTWADGRLAAKTLSEALLPLGLRYGEQYTCVNAFDDLGRIDPVIMTLALRRAVQGWHIVALGQKAARALTDGQVPHVTLMHPAARGRLRQRAQYQAHVARILQPFLDPPGATKAP